MLRVVPPADLLPALAAALDGGPAVVPEVAPAVLAALRPDEPLEHDDVALVVPTSGSTGEPKGVLLTADALRASALATADRLGGSGQWLLAVPPTHSAGCRCSSGRCWPGRRRSSCRPGRSRPRPSPRRPPG